VLLCAIRAFCLLALSHLAYETLPLTVFAMFGADRAYYTTCFSPFPTERRFAAVLGAFCAKRYFYTDFDVGCDVTSVFSPSCICQ
jgi:hypothetical protein